ncbi:MAG: hypothetical protein L6R36_008844 [Xanthoria steineri]|nr:MAG: hypothetical protein L6R36_008844 [Xanthoria steineri]
MLCYCSVWAAASAIGSSGRYSALKGNFPTALTPRVDSQKLGTALGPATALNQIIHYNYPIPGRNAVVSLDFDPHEPLEPGAVYILLSQSLQEIGMKLHFEGDQPVPGQHYSREIIGPRNHHLHIGIWSIDEERKPDELTYRFVEDTLKGLWEYMVRRKVSLNSEARLYQKDMGMVALAFVQDVDSPEEKRKVTARPHIVTR